MAETYPFCKKHLVPMTFGRYSTHSKYSTAQIRKRRNWYTCLKCVAEINQDRIPKKTTIKIDGHINHTLGSEIRSTEETK